MLGSLLLMTALGGGGTAGAATHAPAMRTFDCDTEGPEWPTKAAVRGATFVGRVKEVHEASPGFRTYRLRVLREYEGNFGEQVRVAIQCATTKLEMGKRYLFSSGNSAERGGVITWLAYFDEYGVGWRVRADDSVKLLTYGYKSGAQTAPEWLRSPDTVRQAVRAIYPS